MDGLDIRDDLTEEREEPIEDLVAIPLNNKNGDHIMQIGSNSEEEVRKQLVAFREIQMFLLGSP